MSSLNRSSRRWSAGPSARKPRRACKQILKAVVDRGTAKKAQIAGVSVAGKTGTAQKVINGKYASNRFFATFYGFAPVEDPKLAVIVTFDDPHPDHFGGTVAAPVFRDIVADSLEYLGAQGNKPDGPTLLK